MFSYNCLTGGRRSLCCVNDALASQVDKFRLWNLIGSRCSHLAQRAVIVVKACVVHVDVLCTSRLHWALAIVGVGSSASSRFLLNCFSFGTSLIWFIVNVGANFADHAMLCWSLPVVVLWSCCLHLISGITGSWCRDSIFDKQNVCSSEEKICPST